MATNQFDNYQLEPDTLADNWVFSGDEVHGKRGPNAKISNPHYYMVGTRNSGDYTKTVFGSPSGGINPHTTSSGQASWMNDGWGGHGVDWAQFNYNPYGGRGDGLNVNFRVKNDWLKITGMGGIGVPTDDVMDQDEVAASGMVAYRNYPTEGYSSFGKTTGGASPDKRWAWKGNTWVPAS